MDDSVLRETLTKSTHRVLLFLHQPELEIIAFFSPQLHGLPAAASHAQGCRVLPCVHTVFYVILIRPEYQKLLTVELTCLARPLL
jgi:hypothetical protein